MTSIVCRAVARTGTGLAPGATSVYAARRMGAMDSAERLRSAIEHTLLAADATPDGIGELCRQARNERFAGVCVNPRYVPLAIEQLADSPVRVVTVVGFPLGATLSAAKACECDLVVASGAMEMDMVMDLGAARQGRWTQVESDIRAVVERASGRPVKVILETVLLDDQQKQRACEAAAAAGAAFVKTCTGFAGGGATVHDVSLMRAAVGDYLGIKASGGIRTRQQALALLEAGATRLGTSCGPALLSYEAQPDQT